MARLNDVARDEIKPEHLPFYDSIANSRGSVRGPYGILMQSPDLAARVAHTGAFVRYELDLPESLRERWTNTFAPSIDAMQLALDQRHQSSEVHQLLRKA